MIEILLLPNEHGARRLEGKVNRVRGIICAAPSKKSLSSLYLENSVLSAFAACESSLDSTTTAAIGRYTEKGKG